MGLLTFIDIWNILYAHVLLFVVTPDDKGLLLIMAGIEGEDFIPLIFYLSLLLIFVSFAHIEDTAGFYCVLP